MNDPNLLQAPLPASQTSGLHIVTNSLQPYLNRKNDASPLSPETPEEIKSNISNLNVSHLIVNPQYDEIKRQESIQSIGSNVSSNVSFLDLLSKMSQMEEHSIFMDNGYNKFNTLTDTLQGQLIKAQRISDKKLVVVKKTNKILFEDEIAIQDEMSFCVAENIIKEALILKYLTVDNMSIGDHIVHFIDTFQTENDYYLVMEYIESEMNLKQFIQISHRYIKQGKLKLKQYQKIIKYLYWQLIVTVRWLHCDMNSAHLDLCPENIMLKNCGFTKRNNIYVINNDISIKLGDFGVAEIFSNKDFSCTKAGLSLENEPYLAPKVYNNQLYHALSCDIWALGMILFECMTGRQLYSPMEVLEETVNSGKTFNGYVALYGGKLKKYLQITKLSRYFTADSFNLLVNLLQIDDTKRFTADNILQHQWFSLYYKNYHKRIEKKSRLQAVRCLKQKAKMISFPFYKLKSEEI